MNKAGWRSRASVAFICACVSDLPFRAFAL